MRRIGSWQCGFDGAGRGTSSFGKAEVFNIWSFYASFCFAWLIEVKRKIPGSNPPLLNASLFCLVHCWGRFTFLRIVHVHIEPDKKKYRMTKLLHVCFGLSRKLLLL